MYGCSVLHSSVFIYVYMYTVSLCFFRGLIKSYILYLISNPGPNCNMANCYQRVKDFSLIAIEKIKAGGSYCYILIALAGNFNYN